MHTCGVYKMYTLHCFKVPCNLIHYPMNCILHLMWCFRNVHVPCILIHYVSTPCLRNINVPCIFIHYASAPCLRKVMLGSAKAKPSDPSFLPRPIEFLGFCARRVSRSREGKFLSSSFSLIGTAGAT